MRAFGFAIFGDAQSKAPKEPTLCFRGGDVCDPQNGNWFTPPYPTTIVRKFVAHPILPFLSLALGRYGFYVGWKLYGVDSPQYKNWLPAQDVYNDSQALCLTARFFTDRGQ